MQVVVLCGGLGTRLAELTETKPKSLVTVAGRPFLDWQLERLADSGAQEVVLCTGHLGDLIERHAGERRHGLTLRYSREGGARLGTAGALRNALPLLQSEFVLTYGDSYLPFDYRAPLRELEHDRSALACMSVCAAPDRGNTLVRGDRVADYRKGAAWPDEDYGAIALRRSAVERAPERGDLAALWRELAESGALRALRVSERYFEIGSLSGLNEFERRLSGPACAGAARVKP